MRISLNSIKKYTPIELGVDELVVRINQRLGQVEATEDMADKYKDAVVVRLVACEKHPNADKLSVCIIDDGSKVADAPRDSDGYVQVVCGAPNARADMFAVWLPPKSIVPASYGDDEPFVLDARELRGVMSQGMLAAADELGVGSDHTGIVELSDHDISPESSIKQLQPGQSFAEVFGLDDTAIELENKMFTHRPDCFGQLGVARELAGICEQSFTSPEWYLSDQVSSVDDVSASLDLVVTNDALGAVPRFTAVAISGVQVQPSPLWLQIELVRLGSKPINNIVDLTNYIMLHTAQPVHAYDYDKLRGQTIGARMAEPGEKITLLNNKIYQLNAEDIVIVDGEGAIGLGGVMGGLDSEVTNQTTNVVLEVANFDMYSIRKTSMRHGIFTDAVTRFNKGQSPAQCLPVLRHLISLMPGVQASQVFDLASEQAQKPNPKISISLDFINQRLGLNLKVLDVAKLLENVEFVCQVEAEAFEIEAPFWRTDIELPEDIVEEIGRLYGFDKLPRELPRRSIQPAPKNPSIVSKQRIRDSLARAGANEILSYSFVHEKTFTKSEQDSAQAFSLSNALSPSLQYYRLTVLPSLLEKVHPNIKAGYDEFALFEIGKGHNKKYHADDDDGLPHESVFVDLVYASKKPRPGAAYYRMQRLVAELARDLGFSLQLKTIDQPMDYPVTAPFDLQRSALVESENGEFIGMIGELKQSVLKNFKLPSYTAAATLDFEGLQKSSQPTGSAYRPLSRFPKVTQDISLKVAANVAYQQLFATAQQAVEVAASDSDFRLSSLSIYQSGDDTAHKTITLRLEIASYDKTLTDSEVAAVMDGIAQACADSVGAERV